MKRAVTSVIAAACILFPQGVAYADHGGYEQGDECGRNGGCHNERDENYSGAGCKYVCPSFDKSPVQDAFNINPTICMPGSTCNFDGEKKEGQQPTSGPDLMCIVRSLPFHCDPKPE